MQFLTSKYLFPVLLILFSLTVISFWFGKGKLIAGGEGGLVVFNQINLKEKISPWQRSGTGIPRPFYLSLLSPSLLYEIFSGVGLSDFNIQAIFFFLIFCSGMLGIYILTQKLFSNEKKYRLVPFVASVFYFLNLFTLGQIFNRNLMTGFFLWAYLPIFLLLWIRIIESVTFKKIIIFLLAAFVFSTVYIHPGSIITIWSVALVWTLVELGRNRNKRKKILFTSVLTFLIWFISNLWLFIPYYQLIKDATSSVYGYEYNLDQLGGLSTFFPNREIFLLRQRFVFDEHFHLHYFYKNPLIISLSVVIFLVLLLAVLKAKKGKFGINIIAILFLGWFVSKGTNPPFGYLFYSVIFKLLPFTTALRNSYEKFGIVLVLPYSILFALGVFWIYKKYQSKIIKIMTIIFAGLATVFLCWPLITGNVFADFTYVKVPDYFKQANGYINTDGDLNRILMLPIYKDDSVRYKWGLWAIEPSEFIFDKPTISKPIDGPFEKKYRDLNSKFINHEDYNDILDELNVAYLVLRRDVDPTWGNELSTKEVKDILSKNNKIEFLKSFGELDIYKYNSGSAKIIEVNGSGVPKITFQKVGTLRYVVHVENATKKFQLVFKETFNKLWTAEIEGMKIDSHFIALDYANAWEVDKTGTYDIEIFLDVWLWKDLL